MNKTSVMALVSPVHFGQVGQGAFLGLKSGELFSISTDCTVSQTPLVFPSAEIFTRFILTNNSELCGTSAKPAH